PREDLALRVHDLEADHVRLVELVLGGLRQVVPLERHLGAAVLLGRLGAPAAFEPRHQVAAVLAALRHLDLLVLPRRADPPPGKLPKVLAERPDLHRALPAPGADPPPHHHKFGWLSQPVRRYFAAASTGAL